jgi:hypothetical protein
LQARSNTSNPDIGRLPLLRGLYPRHVLIPLARSRRGVFVTRRALQ